MTEIEEFPHCDGVDFDKICRICLKKKTVIHSVSELYNGSIEFMEMLEYLSGNKICDNSDRQLEVRHICFECSAQLILAYEFKQQCLKSNDIIRKLYSNCKAQTIRGDEYTDQVHFEEGGSDNESIFKDCETELAFPENLSMIKVSIKNSAGLRVNQSKNLIGSNESKLNTSRKECNKSGVRQCLKCNLQFSNFKSYSIHHRQFHKAQVLCPLCGKLVAKHSLENHLASSTHNKTKEHLCTECGKSFTLVENLEKHRRIHTGDKRYICEYCNKKFIHWNSKRSHIRSFHTGEKKYECNICCKRFAQSSNLFRHIRSHTGEMPHECSFCHKKFKTSPELKNHIVVHTKERNHICNICNKAFGTKKSLSAHLKIHTGERNYVCTVCSKAYTQAHVLRSHLKTHPNVPIPPAGAVLSQKALNKLPILIDPKVIADKNN